MFQKVFAVALCVATGACVTLPTEHNDGVSIERVVGRVKCELAFAAANHPQLATWAGNITLTLQVDTAGAVLPSTTLSGPFSAGAFGLEIGGGVSAKAIQTSLVSIYFPLGDLRHALGDCPPVPRSPLEGSLGLTQWLDRTLEVWESTGGMFKDKDKAIGHTVEFDLEVSAGVKPGFTFARATGNNGLSASRKTYHTLQIALADTLSQPPAGTTAHAPAAKSTLGERSGARPAARQSALRPARGASVGADDRKQLDNVIQQLQFRTLRLR